MGDGRTVYVISPDKAGESVAVQLRDDADMTLEVGLAIKEAAEQTYGNAQRYMVNTILIDILSRCPELFQQQYDAENPPPVE